MSDDSLCVACLGNCARTNDLCSACHSNYRAVRRQSRSLARARRSDY